MIIRLAVLLGTVLTWPALASESIQEPTPSARRPITAWPLVFHESDAERAQTDILWPLMRYERKDTWTRYALRPFVLSTESDPARDYRKTSVLWPISVYEHEGEGRSFRIFPIYWYEVSPESKHNIVFPFYWDGEDKDSSYFHLWPLFGVNHRGANFTEYSTLYPFFRYGSDPASGEREVHAFWPLFSIHQNKDYLAHRFLPFYWREKDVDKDGGFVFPYYWRQTTGEAARGIFPLWYSSAGPERETDLIFPVYFNREHGPDRLRLITPLYLDWRTQDSELQTLIPLYLNYKKPELRVRLGLPSYLRYESGPRTFSTIFPLYYHAEDRERQSEMTYYFPVYGTYRRGETVSRHFLFFPLYSRFQDQELNLHGWDIVWPLFHHESSPESFATRVLPFYWRSHQPDYDLTALLPFYGSLSFGENSYTHLLPFYGVHKKGDWYSKRFILGPLFMDTRDEHAQRSQQDVLFPIFSRAVEGERERTWLFPLYLHKSGPGQSLTLASPALLPPYYVNRQSPDSELFHVWPFYGRSRSDTYEEYSTLWPLFRFGKDPVHSLDMTHLLLYYRKSEAADTFTALVPFWMHRTQPESTVDASLLLHRYEENRADNSTEWSFLWLGWPKLSLAHYESAPDKLSHRFFPIYSYSSRDSDRLDWSLLWPLLSHERDGPNQHETKFLWRVFSYERTDSATTDARVLWRFIRKSESPDASIFEFNPFFYRKSEPDGGAYWAILGGLVARETESDGQSRMHWLWIF